MTPVCTYTDYFVICSGQNPRQTKSIHDEIHATLKAESRTLPVSTDGVAEAKWIVADYVDVVLHVFTPEARTFYALEDLWGDVPSVELDAATA
jgi:ribosome-associated protein